MESYRYVDIFATKGIEYLLVLGFLVAFVLMWKMVRTPATARSAAGGARLPRPGEWFRFDQGLFYHPGHSWAAPEGNELVRVGLDDFAWKLVGQPDSIDLPRRGARVHQGETGWMFNIQDRPVAMLSPVDGEVVEVNEAALRDPAAASDDPYGEGWLLKVRPRNRGRDLHNLLSGRFARTWLNETVHAVRERMTGNLGIVLQDGGMPVRGFVMVLSPDDWEKTAAEFLRTD